MKTIKLSLAFLLGCMFLAACGGGGGSSSAPTSYSVVETFYEPMAMTNTTVFTGTFTYDPTSQAVSNLTGSLTEAMTMTNTVTLSYQLSSVPVVVNGVNGLLVTTFAVNTTNTFSPSGFAPGPNNYTTYGNDNAYATIFVNTANPATPLPQAQIDELAYADCTADGLMMSMYCMTGLMNGTVPGGSMDGYPISETITPQ